MLNRSIAGATLLILVTAFGLGCASGGSGLFSSDLKKVNDYTYDAKANMLTNYKARNDDGTVNVVIEIPAGSNEKWEVSDDGSQLVWEFTGNAPRIIDYLPYPGNYGLIPRTWLDPEKGGDGGAVDVLVLGTALPRGEIVRATPIGVIRVIDRFEQDDKILAIHVGASFRGVTDIESLNDRYPGASEILGLWFSNAHGTSEVQLMGTGSRAQANAVIDYADEAFRKRSISQQKTSGDD